MNSIKFEHSQDGVVNFNSGNTGLSNSMALGALALTRKYSYPDKSERVLKYATDKKGLEEAISIADDLTDFLQISISTLGVCLPHLDTSEVKHELKSIGWLIAGLSDLAHSVSYEKGDMQAVLDMAKKSPD